MANLKQIVYLSEAQKDVLFENNTITVDGITITYSDNDIYCTPEVLDAVPTSGSTNMVSSSGIYTALQNKQNNIEVVRFI